MNDYGVCSLLGLAKRAGKLAAGDEAVKELSRTGVIRAVFLSEDAGAAVSRQAAFLAGRANAPLLTIPCTKAELGGALGWKSCALCAVSDIGFAASAAKKLAPVSEKHAAAAEELAAKNVRIQSRRGVKKHRTGEKSGENNQPLAVKKQRAAAKPAAKIDRPKRFK